MTSPPLEWLSRPAKIRDDLDTMRNWRCHVELHVSEYDVQILLASHIDVDRQAEGLRCCLDAIIEPELFNWQLSKSGRMWSMAWNLAHPGAQSRIEHPAWKVLGPEHEIGLQ